MTGIGRFVKNVSPFNNREDMPKALFIIKKLLAYLLCSFGGMIAGTAVVVLIHFPLGLNPLNGEAFEGYAGQLFTMLNYLLPTLCVVPYWLFVEKKKMRDMYVRKGAGCYLIGCAAAAGMLAACVGAVLLTGSVRINGAAENPDILAIALNGGIYLFQSAREEILCRGLMFCMLKDKLGAPAAFAASTAVFAVPHLSSMEGAGAAVTAVGILNMVLISAIFTLIVLVIDSLWAACGVHFVWNFCLDNILGLTVSGTDSGSNALISAESVGSSILNGGIFGIEASVITTAVYAVCAAGLLVMLRKRNENKKTVNEGDVAYGF